MMRPLRVIGLFSGCVFALCIVITAAAIIIVSGLRYERFTASKLRDLPVSKRCMEVLTSVVPDKAQFIQCAVREIRFNVFIEFELNEEDLNAWLQTLGKPFWEVDNEKSVLDTPRQYVGENIGFMNVDRQFVQLDSDWVLYENIKSGKEYRYKEYIYVNAAVNRVSKKVMMQIFELR
ncbi:MAG: hypothetical protein KF752_00745 [Pirellulaceae bacterium]|nr:hypothetical protein [Pirellulaceae bacterium]